MSGGTGPVWVITGMSGAGKATALSTFERSGFTCIDNLPAGLLDQVRVDAAGLAVVIDTRQAESLDAVAGRTGRRVIFLDARDDVLARRLSESIRPHPLAAAGGSPAAIAAERETLGAMRAAADVVLDTSTLSTGQLHDRLVEVLGLRDGGTASMLCTVSSFGFKYGAQIEADWVIDVRFLPNPFWEPELRPLTGNDRPVVDYVLGGAPGDEFADRLTDLLRWTLSQAVARGRTRLHVAVGCTGGRHRSVAVANRLASRLVADDVAVVVRHRDVERPDPR